MRNLLREGRPKCNVNVTFEHDRGMRIFSESEVLNISRVKDLIIDEACAILSERDVLNVHSNGHLSMTEACAYSLRGTS